jgi:hypothetical protein
MSDDKKDGIREELDEWLAAGKIDRETYDRLIAEQAGADGERLGSGMLTGSAGFALGLGLSYLMCSWLEFRPDVIWRIALAMAAASCLTGALIARRPAVSELGRILGIVAGFMWPIGYVSWLQSNPEQEPAASTVLFTVAAGELLIGYLSTSAMVACAGLFWIVPAVFWWLIESGYELVFGQEMVILSVIGIGYLTAAREHLVWHWPRGVWHRFAAGYQMLGLFLLNWSTYALSWGGWDGEGYQRVVPRLVCVTASMMLYSLEVWAGQTRRMPAVAAMGIYQFVLQILGILSYPHISLEQRALIVIVYAVLLIVVAQGDSASRRGPA